MKDILTSHAVQGLLVLLIVALYVLIPITTLVLVVLLVGFVL